MNARAIVLADSRTAHLRVAALSLLERLIVALRRGGCSHITVVADGPLPDMERVRALDIKIDVARVMPSVADPAVVASTGMLVRAPDVSRVIREDARLVAADGTPLPLGVVSRWTQSMVTTPGAAFERALADRPCVVSDGSATRVSSPADMGTATRTFWSSLKSSTDSMLDRFVNRPLCRPLSKLLVHTAVTPNQVSVAALAIGLAAAYSFSLATYTSTIVGALLFQLAAVVDCLDGDLAFAVFKESTLGKWLDITLDQIVHWALFVGIAVAVARTSPETPVVALLASTVIGMLIAFTVVIRGMLQPPEHRNPTLATLVDTFENRDFSVALLIFALVGKLELFLWCAAFGVHVFWLVALAVQVLSTVRRRPARESA